MRVATNWILLTKPGLLHAELKLTLEWKEISTCSWGGEKFCVTACTCSGSQLASAWKKKKFSVATWNCSQKILSNFKLLPNIFVTHCMFITMILFFLLDWQKIVISWSFTKPTWSTAYLYMNGRKRFCRPRYAWFHSKFIFGSWSHLVFTIEFMRTQLYHQSGCKCT